MNGDGLTRAGLGPVPGLMIFFSAPLPAAPSLSRCELGEIEEERSRGRRRAKSQKGTRVNNIHLL